MDSTKANEFHGQLRENTDELNDYIHDLNKWIKDIKQKDEDLRQTQHVVENDLPPIRKNILIPKQESETQQDETVSKKDKTKQTRKKISSYDYDSWEKFNVDKALEDVDTESNNNTDTEDLEETEQMQMMQKAEVEKEKGNRYFKEKKYDEAIECYTLGIQCDPGNAILPANRAMALMKKEQFAAAEVDCKVSIDIDPTYVKAFHRRGTCRFALKKYQLARQDFLKVMELDPGNKLAKTELEKLEKIFINNDLSENTKIEVTKSKEDAKESPCDVVKPITKPVHLQSKKALKRIKIQDATVEGEKNGTILTNKASVITSSKPATPPKEAVLSPIITAPPALPPAPHTSFQFLTDWKRLQKFPDLQCHYLKQIPPTQLPQIFMKSMESETFSDVLRILQNHANEFGDDITLSYLQQLTEVGRFQTLVLFLTDEEKKGIRLFLETTSKTLTKDASQLLKLYRL